MSTVIDRVARDLFEGETVVRDIKFCYRNNSSTGEQLADYRDRVDAQIRSGVARADLELDSVLRESSVD